jgi:hypothetical protein
MMPGGGAADWFGQQGSPQAPAPTAPGMAPPIQNGMAAAQQSLEALRNSPGYQFRMNEGIKQLERSAASRGTLLTGGTLKGLQRYAQDYASGEYNNRNNQLFGWAGLGMNAAGAQAGQNSQYATTAGDLMTQQGNAQAAGTVGGANAWNQYLQQAPGNIAQMYYLSQIMQPTGTPPYNPDPRFVRNDVNDVANRINRGGTASSGYWVQR